MSSKNWQWLIGLTLLSAFLWFFNLRLILPKKVDKILNLAPAEKAVVEAEIANLQQENSRLRDLLGAPLSPGWQFLPAPVVDIKADILTLGVGKATGVKEGAVVMAYQKESINNGVVLGRVVEVWGRQSKVRLLSSRELSVKAKTSSGASGVVTGDGQMAWLNQVVQADKLAVGDLILTAGGDGWLPGLVIGRVGETVKAESAIYQNAKVDLIIDPGSVVNVYLVSD